MRIGHHALAAERIAGIDLLAGAGVFRPGIDFPGRFDLLRRQAGAGLRLAPAGERGDVEAACGRVGDDPVGDAVDRVAGRDDLAVEEQQIVVRQYLPTVVAGPMVGEIVPEERERQVGAVVPRRARYDAVEIVGIALRLAQPLIAAGRTAAEIIPLRGFAIEGGGDRLCRDRRFMDGAIAEIYDPVAVRSEEHTSELQSLLRISYAVFCLKTKI